MNYKTLRLVENSDSEFSQRHVALSFVFVPRLGKSSARTPSTLPCCLPPRASADANIVEIAVPVAAYTHPRRKVFFAKRATRTSLVFGTEVAWRFPAATQATVSNTKIKLWNCLRFPRTPSVCSTSDR